MTWMMAARTTGRSFIIQTETPATQDRQAGRPISPTPPIPIPMGF